MTRKKILKKKTIQYNIAAMQPDEINSLRVLAVEYIKRRQNIENEISTLKEDLKELDAEFAEKLDLKHLKLAEKVLHIEQGVAHKDTYDLFQEALKDPTL